MDRKTLIIYFLVDTSKSMTGDKIGSVNAVIREILSDLKKRSDDNTDIDVEVKIAVLSFSSGARWETVAPVPLQNFYWDNLETSGFFSDFGAACEALHEKLSRKGFMGDSFDCFAPVLILLSDGRPTDHYAYALQKLKENNWYKSSVKIAVSVGVDANIQMLSEFTGTPEAVVSVNDLSVLKNMAFRCCSLEDDLCPDPNDPNDDDDDEYPRAQIIEKVMCCDPDNPADDPSGRFVNDLCSDDPCPDDPCPDDPCSDDPCPDDLCLDDLFPDYLCLDDLCPDDPCPDEW